MLQPLSFQKTGVSKEGLSNIFGNDFVKMVEAVAGDGWFGENFGLKIVGFEGKDEKGCCIGVLDEKTAGRHI